MVNPLKNNRTPKFSKPPQQGRAATTTSDYEHANVKYLKELVVGNITANQLSGATLVNVSGAGAGQWDRNGNNIFPKDLIYNVGINTQNPQGKLDVNGDIITKELHVDPVATINRLTVTGSITMSGANIITNGEWISGDGDDEGIFIDNSGNVGINTSNPTSSFVVQGEANFNDETNLNDVSFINATSTFNDTATFNSNIVSWGGATFNSQIETNSGINMDGSNISLNGGWLSGDGGNEGVYVFNDGHVGIGTDTQVNPVFGSRDMTIAGNPAIVTDLNVKSPFISMQDLNDNQNYFNYGMTSYSGDPITSTGITGFFNTGSSSSGRFDMRFAGNEQFFFYGDGTFVTQGTGNVGIGVRTPSSKLDIDGSVAKPIKTVTSNTTAGNDDYTFIGDTSSNSVTVTLPTASSCEGRIYVFKKISASNNLTIDGSGSETIDGATTYDLTADDESAQIQSNGSGWFVISDNK